MKTEEVPVACHLHSHRLARNSPSSLRERPFLELYKIFIQPSMGIHKNNYFAYKVAHFLRADFAQVLLIKSGCQMVDKCLHPGTALIFAPCHLESNVGS